MLTHTPSPLEFVMGPLPQQTPQHSPSQDILSQSISMKPTTSNSIGLCSHASPSLVLHPDTKQQDTLGKGEAPRWNHLVLYSNSIYCQGHRLVASAQNHLHRHVSGFLHQLPQHLPFWSGTLAHTYPECTRPQPLHHLPRNLFLRF